MKMSLVSLTLVGADDAQVGETLRRVPRSVDRCLVVDRGASPEQIAEARQAAAERLTLSVFGAENSAAAARDHGLAAAAEAGGTWVVMIDAGEQLQCDDLCGMLGAAKEAVLLSADVPEATPRARFIRLPAVGRHAGPTRELYLPETGASRVLQPGIFSQLPRSEQQRTAEVRREIQRLTAYVADNPDEPIWYYELGDAYHELGCKQEAIASWEICANLHGPAELRAWALYRAGWAWVEIGRPELGIESCARGMANHAGMPELPWLAAYAAHRADRSDQAICWAQIAVSLGNFAGMGAQIQRTRWRHPIAAWEGPFDVLRFTFSELGEVAAAQEAEQQFKEALTARQASEASE